MILRQLFPRTVGVIATWQAMDDDPVLLCACQDGDWCEWCEPIPASVADASEGLLPAA